MLKCVVLTYEAFYKKVWFVLVPNYVSEKMRYKGDRLGVIGLFGQRVWNLPWTIGLIQFMEVYVVDQILELIVLTRSNESDCSIGTEPRLLLFKYNESIVVYLKAFMDPGQSFVMHAGVLVCYRDECRYNEMGVELAHATLVECFRYEMDLLRVPSIKEQAQLAASLRADSGACDGSSDERGSFKAISDVFVLESEKTIVILKAWWLLQKLKEVVFERCSVS